MRIANLSVWVMAGVVFLSGALAGLSAMAGEVAGRPVDREMGFQRAVTEVMHDIVWLDNFLLYIGGAIVLFVTLLMLFVIVRFNKRANPVPASFTHNAPLEIAWTAIPVLILVIIAIPSLRLLFLQLEVPEPDLTIKATGSQWYWTYEYPDAGIEFDAVMLEKDELAQYGYTAGDFLLATDTRVVVPVNAVVHVLVTGSDVIHSWAIPSFGSKIDAVPGRLNETWFRAEETGIFFGQCSELCGMNHSYMPIVVEVVSQQDYDAWVRTQQAMNGAATTTLAAAE
ncbi:MAG: cytochrome c oxidase subunit II [Proteobacteria bacterium]|nr:cytochrome c oxidase subunit II [Pseudomonadota bacterium]